MINRHLELRLLRRGHLKIIKEIESRQRLVGRDTIVYSTAEAAEEQGRDFKDDIVTSSAIRTRNAFDDSKLKSGRTKFFEYGGKVCCEQPFRQRVMRKK